MFGVTWMFGLKDLDTFLFSIGGALLLFAIYLVISTPQSPYSSGSIVVILAIGFVGFWLLAEGLYGIIESATASKK